MVEVSRPLQQEFTLLCSEGALFLLPSWLAQYVCVCLCLCLCVSAFVSCYCLKEQYMFLLCFSDAYSVFFSSILACVECFLIDKSGNHTNSDTHKHFCLNFASLCVFYEVWVSKDEFTQITKNILHHSLQGILSHSSHWPQLDLVWACNLCLVIKKKTTHTSAVNVCNMHRNWNVIRSARPHLKVIWARYENSPYSMTALCRKLLA